MKTDYKLILTFAFIFIGITASAQLKGVYFAESDSLQHELKVKNNYLVHSVYQNSPAKFVKTLGGFFRIKNDTLMLRLEFNSNYEKDSIAMLKIPITLKENQVTFTDSELLFKASDSNKQALDGMWLFGTRGPDIGQERRGDSKSRKTLKFLVDGRFQWIAYDTKSMQFKGSGGGSYTADDGKYIENIEYFSRDNNRVGAVLEFDYEVKGTDWHHTGKNSKGEPMYEIWMRRIQNN